MTELLEENITMYSTPWGCYPPPVNQEEYIREISDNKYIIIVDQTPYFSKLLEEIKNREKRVIIIDHHGINYPYETSVNLLRLEIRSRRIAIVNPAWFGKNGGLSASMITYDILGKELGRLSLFYMLLGAHCDRKTDHYMVYNAELNEDMSMFVKNRVFEEINSLISKMVYLSKLERIPPETIIRFISEIYENGKFNVITLKALTGLSSISSDPGILSSSVGPLISRIYATWPDHSKIIRSFIQKYFDRLPIIPLSSEISIALAYLDTTLPKTSILTGYEDLSRYLANLFLARYYSYVSFKKRVYLPREILETFGIVAVVYNGKILSLTGRKTDKQRFLSQNIGELFAKISFLSIKKLTEILGEEKIEIIKSSINGGGHPEAGGMKIYNVQKILIPTRFLLDERYHLDTTQLIDLLRESYKIKIEKPRF